MLLESAMLAVLGGIMGIASRVLFMGLQVRSLGVLAHYRGSLALLSCVSLVAV
jgi:hypothetical protein